MVPAIVAVVEITSGVLVAVAGSTGTTKTQRLLTAISKYIEHDLSRNLQKELLVVMLSVGVKF